MNHNEGEVVIKCRTEGLEEASQELEAIADAYDGFPAQVTLKYCHDCHIEIYPSQTKIIEVGEKEPEEE